MHVSGKKMAFCGLSLALTTILVVLSGILDFNTLFLLGAASFFIGVIIRECGMKMGAAFYVAAVLMGVILAPNKLYCVTFAAMGLYVVGVELVWRLLGKTKTNTNRTLLFWVFKFLLFNIMFLPMLFLFPKLLFAGKIHGGILLGGVLLGQVVLVIYDKAYEYFLVYVWGNFRKRIKLEL